MTDRFKRALSTASAPQELRNKTLDAVDARRRTRMGRGILRAAVASVAFAAAIMGFTVLRVSRIETAYVSLDVNPSIALSINSYGRVIGASAYGASSQEVLEAASVRNEPYEVAVRNLLDAATMQPYLDENQDLWIAVQADSPEVEAQMESALESMAAQAMEAAHPGISVNASTVTLETRTTSESVGMTATKYIAICELQELDETATMDAYRESSIGEIHAHIDECMERAESGHVWPDHAAETPAPQAEETPAQTEAPQATEPPAAAVQPATTQAAQGGHGHHAGGHHG